MRRTVQPGRIPPTFDDHSTQLRTEIDPSSAEKEPRPGVAEMIGHEVARRDAVSVREDHVRGIGTGQGPVQNPALPESPVFVPDMTDSQSAIRELPDYPLDPRTGTIIGDRDAEFGLRLSQIS
jgi:hypothetical protein